MRAAILFSALFFLTGCGKTFMEGKWTPDTTAYQSRLERLASAEREKAKSENAVFDGAELEIDGQFIITTWPNFGYKNAYRILSKSENELVLAVDYLRNGTFRWIVRQTAGGIEIQREENLPVPFRRTLSAD